MRVILLLAALCALGLAGSGVAAQSAPVPASDPPVFRVGDAVRIAVWGNPELSGEFEIAEDGTVIHPLYRTIRIAGMSLPQAEREFRRVLQRFETEPEFVVEPLFRVAIGGEVRLPSIYTLPPHTSVAQAVIQAGGPTPTANLQRARLLREGREIHVDLTRPHSEVADLRLRSGDQIILDTRRNLWRERIQPALTSVGAVASIAYTFLRITRIR